MKQVEFKRLGAISVRVQTVDAVRNDLAIRVDSVRVYDPQQAVNDRTRGEAPGPFREGVRCYVEAYKNSGATYQVSAWDAAICFDGPVVSKGGGFNSEAVAGADGYYPMGDFVVPSFIDVELEGLRENAVYRLAYVFQSGGMEVVPWVAEADKEKRRWLVDRQDTLSKVWLLEDNDPLPTR